MYNQNEGSAIPCKIHHESTVAMKVLKQQINQAELFGIKAKHADELLNEANGLVNCPHFDNQNNDCMNCQIIAHLHIKIAQLIIKAKSLSQ